MNTPRRCSWRGCLSGQTPMYEAELSVWNHDDEPHASQATVRFKLDGWLFCLHCATNRNAAMLLEASEKLRSTVRQIFHRHKKGMPRLETSQVKWLIPRPKVAEVKRIR